MDVSDALADEIVADSEEEGPYFPTSNQSHGHDKVVANTRSTNVNLDTPNFTGLYATGRSNISAFSESPLKPPFDSAFSPIESVSTAYIAPTTSHFAAMSSPLADTSKAPRPRPRPRPVNRNPASDDISLPSDPPNKGPEASSSAAGSSRPKPRPRPRKLVPDQTSMNSDAQDPPSRNFDSVPPAPTSDDHTKPRPRPRPRPRTKNSGASPTAPSDLSSPGKQTAHSGLHTSTPDKSVGNSDVFGLGTGIAERAKMRQRGVKLKSTTASSQMPMPTPSLAIISQLPPPKNPNSRKKRAPSPTKQLDIIELTSDDEDQLSNSDPHHSNNPNSSGNAGKTFGHCDPSSQPSIPVPTSPFWRRNSSMSHLPPSDPPPSTNTEPDLPPIAVLHDQDGTSGVEAELSDDSLFGEVVGLKKRKRAVVTDDSDFEGEQSRTDPPPFFASSSQINGDMLPDPKPPKQKPSTRKRKPAGGSDDAHSSELSGRTKPKPKRPQKGKKAALDEEVEVLVDSPSIPSAKKRGKRKEAEVFKSREFIDDDDDDIDVSSEPAIATSRQSSDSTAVVSNAPSSIPHDADEQADQNQQLDDNENRSATSLSQSHSGLGGKRNAAGIQSQKDRSKKKPNQKRKVATSDDEDDHRDDSHSLKENLPPGSTPAVPSAEHSTPIVSKLSSRYSLGPRSKSTPMSELIRRVNSHPGSPFSASPAARAGITYSPYLKASRSFLSRIAPLHPNRRTPPPPPPPPPPRKKSKKELEREERWEEEMIESAGGVSEWSCLSDAERKEIRRAKWEMEMGGWD